MKKNLKNYSLDDEMYDLLEHLYVMSVDLKKAEKSLNEGINVISDCENNALKHIYKVQKMLKKINTSNQKFLKPWIMFIKDSIKDFDPEFTILSEK